MGDIVPFPGKPKRRPRRPRTVTVEVTTRPILVPLGCAKVTTRTIRMPITYTVGPTTPGRL